MMMEVKWWAFSMQEGPVMKRNEMIKNGRDSKWKSRRTKWLKGTQRAFLAHPSQDVGQPTATGQWFRVVWTSTFTWRPAMHFKDIILVIWASIRPSNRKVPFLCLVTDWTSPIYCWKSRTKWQSLTHFNIIPSLMQDISKNLGLLGKPELKNYLSW